MHFSYLRKYSPPRYVHMSQRGGVMVTSASLGGDGKRFGRGRQENQEEEDPPQVEASSFLPLIAQRYLVGGQVSRKQNCAFPRSQDFHPMLNTSMFPIAEIQSTHC